ncbi:2-dehydropantoate 2-reductase [Roseomonas alkaliterrae]|uniref:2-dehydropantoate 2-reductase n=1 Tax=Neoroseomonas alkaliterrae TaxID=1452450 RepID=A0A840XW77_9PROT|nr:2-dehydropantoate 2-reductase [Neoroseomonas alkaliterrae]MBB5688387.1 2-dehydropantoate 2-reductase [Neoroseomonas alkaliterrae]MBR0677013.1 2-dehydropantoate 2-reductase [Neoroseomonas alkaliterrae]
MRVLVLGAGALGAYFGGRLAEAGTAEVAFLVRPARAAALARDGLRIESPFGAWQGRVATLTAGEVRPGWDVVLLACKAYDLDEAIAAIRPAVDARSAILPVLNGIAHLDSLDAAFGRERVLGGLARIQATLAPDGTVRQLNDWRWLTFGERDGTISERVRAIAAAFAPARGVEAQAVTDIAARMWEKLVHLGTAAAGTVLMRANVGEIVRAGGAGLLHRLLDRNAAVAAARGFPMREAFMAEFRALFSDPASAYATSMLRDLEAGGRIEADHILGWLLGAVREAGIADELHEAALLHARAYAERRAAGRLPKG